MILAVVTSRYLWPLKVKIWNQVNKSCEVSNHRFLGVTISFWDAFLTSDDHRGRDLQISMTSGGKNMKSMKISHARSQIIGFLVFRFNSETLFRSHGHRGLDQILMTFRGPTMKKNVNSAFYYHCFCESNSKHIFESEGAKCLSSPEVEIQNHWTWIMLRIKCLVFYCSSLSLIWGDFKWILNSLTSRWIWPQALKT